MIKPKQLGDPLLAALLLALAWIATDRLAQPQADRTDEAEWTAISLNTVRQLHGGVPPGTRRDQREGQLHEDPWRQGVQATTFGWPNPIFHKLIWGQVCSPVAPDRLKPDLFQRYHRGNLAKANAAVMKLLPAIERARSVVAFASALCALFLFLIARHLAGWMAASVAYSLWLFHPLVRAWSHQTRPDFGMLALMLACLWIALSAAPALSGERGARRLIGTGILLASAAGLCVATKLNGGLAAVFVLLVLPLGALIRSADTKAGWGLRLGLATCCAVVVAGVLFALFPYLWSSPRSHLGEVLAFWSEHMSMQQDRLESFGGIATRSLGARWDLVAQRMGGPLDPLRASIGLSGGLLWPALGVAALVTSARRSKTLQSKQPIKQLRVAMGLLWLLIVGSGSLLWLPLNWDRYFFPLAACWILLEASLIGVLFRAFLTDLRARSRKRSL